jgi:hypothetical protein
VSGEIKDAQLFVCKDGWQSIVRRRMILVGLSLISMA